MELGSSSTQILATAFTFGLTALAFAYLPFVFVLANGLIKANRGHNAHSSSVLSVFTFAFAVHFISCIFFMTTIKMLDVLGTIYQSNYLQETIFNVFWTRGESEVLSLAGSSSSTEDKGAYLQLYMVQLIADWLMILTIPLVFICACSYAMVQTKKDAMHFNVVSFTTWLIIANFVAYFVYYLWALIATLALFIPDESLPEKIIGTYKEIIQGALG